MPLVPLDKAELVFVMPVGPRANLEYVLDTVDSIRHNMKAVGLLLGVEEGADELRAKLEAGAPDATVTFVKLPKPPGKGGYNTKGKLFLKTARLLREAVQRSPARAVIKIDDDAIILRPGLEDDIERLLKANPRCGGFGTVRHGFRGPVRKTPMRRALFESTVMWFKDPAVARTIAPLVFGSMLRGKRPSLNVAGMCSGYTRQCIERMVALGLFDRDELIRSLSQEDRLLSSAAMRLGYDLCDFPVEGNPFGFHWKHLPASPEVLWESGVKVVHSVHDQEYGTEAEIREYFRRQVGR
jgi:hypothetical protein